MEPLDQLVAWGYQVDQSQEVDGVPIWHIAGYGMNTYVRDDDAETLESLANEEAHNDRKEQFENPQGPELPPMMEPKDG
jgi:hypothetical protein